MAKYSIFADVHLHKWTEFAKYSKDGVNDRLLDGMSVLEQIFSYTHREGLDGAICAGDLAHKRGTWDVQVLNSTADKVRKWSRHFPIIFMPGNHDQATKDGRVHGLEVLADVGATIVGREKVDDFYFFPYVDSEELFWQQVKEAKVAKNSNAVGIMHHGFRGARVGSSLEYVVKEPIEPGRLIEAGFKRVFSGHYHTRQTLVDGVQYIGSPQEHVRADKTKERKGFLVYDTEKDTVTVVPVKAPRFVTVTSKTDKADVEGNFVDVVCDLEDAKEVEKDLLDLGARAVKVIPRTQEVTKTRKRLDIDPGLSHADVIKKYVKWSAKHGKTDLPADELVKIGNEILSEVES